MEGTILEIPETKYTPKVVISEESILIKGSGMPENSREFFQLFFNEEIKEKLRKLRKIIITIELDHFSNSFSKELLDFFKFFVKEKLNAEVAWLYEEDDEDMIEAGEDYQAILFLPFKLVGYQK